MFLRNPPEGWRPSGGPPPAAGKGTARGGRDFLPREMVGTGVFRRMWIAYAFGTAAGLMVIGHLAAFALGAGFSPRGAGPSRGGLSVGAERIGVDVGPQRPRPDALPGDGCDRRTALPRPPGFHRAAAVRRRLPHRLLLRLAARPLSLGHRGFLWGAPPRGQLPPP